MNYVLLVIAFLFFSASLDLNIFGLAQNSLSPQSSMVIDQQENNIEIKEHKLETFGQNLRLHLTVEPNVVNKIKQVNGIRPYYFYVQAGYGTDPNCLKITGNEDKFMGAKNLPWIDPIRFFNQGSAWNVNEEFKTTFNISPQGGLDYSKHYFITVCTTVWELVVGDAKNDPFGKNTDVKWRQVSKMETTFVEITRQVPNYKINVRLCEDIATSCGDLGLVKQINPPTGSSATTERSQHFSFTVIDGNSLRLDAVPKQNSQFVKWICVAGNCEGETEEGFRLNHKPTSDEIWVAVFKQNDKAILYIDHSVNCCAKVYVGGIELRENEKTFEYIVGDKVEVIVLNKINSNACLYPYDEDYACAGKTIFMITEFSYIKKISGVEENLFSPEKTDPTCLRLRNDFNYGYECGAVIARDNPLEALIEMDGDVNMKIRASGYPILCESGERIVNDLCQALDPIAECVASGKIWNAEEGKCESKTTPGPCTENCGGGELPPAVQTVDVAFISDAPNWVMAMLGGLSLAGAVNLIRIPFLTGLL